MAKVTPLPDPSLANQFAPAFDRFGNYTRNHPGFWDDLREVEGIVAEANVPSEQALLYTAPGNMRPTMYRRHQIGFMAVMAALETDASLNACRAGISGQLVYGLSAAQMKQCAERNLNSYDLGSPEPCAVETFRHAIGLIDES